MEFGCKAGAAWLPKWMAGVMGAVLLLTAVVTATAERPERDRNDRGALGQSVALGSTIMNRNRAILIIANGRGQAGSIASGSSVGNGGFWVTTANAYIFAAGPTIGGLIPGAGANAVDTAVFIAGPFSQAEPG